MKFTTLLLLLSVLTANAMPIREALGQIESGNDDNARGASGEVSRYQILPQVWAKYSRSLKYNNERVAWSIARRIINQRSSSFERSHNRKPTPFEIYVLWNAPAQITRPSHVVTERANRFANLVNSNK